MSTLQNFGVPTGFGTGRGGILMPKVKNRFRVFVYNFGGIAQPVAFTQQIISASRPNVTFDPQEVHAYNSVAYYGGKAKWETVTVTVRDDVTNSVAALCGSQTQRQMNFFTQTVPEAAADYKFMMTVETLDGSDDGILERWVYEGCFLSQVNYESFDYSSSDAMTIELTVRFDNATQDNSITPGIMPPVPILNLPSPFTG
jgi:hypothetical protein